MQAVFDRTAEEKRLVDFIVQSPGAEQHLVVLRHIHHYRLTVNKSTRAFVKKYCQLCGPFIGSHRPIKILSVIGCLPASLNTYLPTCTQSAHALIDLQRSTPAVLSSTQAVHVHLFWRFGFEISPKCRGWNIFG